MITDSIKITDWRISRFILLVLIIQVSLLFLISLDNLGINVPLLRPILAFIYLTYIPGIIILRIFKIHNLGIVRLILYSTGLSLAAIMTIGVIMNSLLPYIGVNAPLSAASLILTLSVLTLILCFVCYKRDRYFTPSVIDKHHIKITVYPVLLLLLILFLAIMSTLIVQAFGNNVLLMMVIVIIAILPIVITKGKLIPETLYPMLVLVTALALLYHNTFISEFLTGWDVHLEYQYANLVYTHSIWDSSIPDNYNAMLSITVLLPVYAKITGIGIVSVVKVIYPLIFALVPVGIYEYCRIRTNSKIAFLSAFLFISVPAFYITMTSITRQQIAELFLVLLVLLVLDNKLSTGIRKIFALIFGASLVVSHYGTSYLFLGCIIAGFIVLYIVKVLAKSNINEIDTKSPVDNFHRPNRSSWLGIEAKILSPIFIMIFIVFCVIWYLWQSESTTFNTMVNLGDNVLSNLITGFFKRDTSEAVSVISATRTPIHEIAKYLNLFTQLFIFIGVITLIRQWKQKPFPEEYMSLSISACIIAIAAIAIPYVSGALHAARLYHVTLILLAPFCIKGAIDIKSFIIIRKFTRHTSVKTLMSCILAIYMLFSVGFIYEITGDQPSSISLSKNSIIKSGDSEVRAGFYNAYTIGSEVAAAQWLSNNISSGESLDINATYYDASRVHVLTSYGMIPIADQLAITESQEEFKQNSYVFLRSMNILAGLGISRSSNSLSSEEVFDFSALDRTINKKARKIYSTNASEIYYVAE